MRQFSFPALPVASQILARRPSHIPRVCPIVLFVRCKIALYLYCCLSSIHTQESRQCLSQITSMHDSINHTMLERELSRDCPFGKFQVHKSLYYSWPREADECSWLCQDHITQHTKTCCYTTARGIG